MDGIIGTILGTVGSVLEKVIPDTNKRKEAEEAFRLALESNEFQLAIEQIKVNAIEAASEDKFTKRWRPFIGWTCGAAFALHFVIFPILNWIVALFGGPAISIVFDMQSLMYALGGLLGLGGFRTYEKIKGVTK
jgi:hypothetical protein